jgi:hypothetical protein
MFAQAIIFIYIIHSHESRAHQMVDWQINPNDMDPNGQSNI